MLSELYETLDSTEVKGEDIVIPDHAHNAMYISQRGDVFCYLGICSRNSDRISAKSWPYYLVGKHTQQCKKQIRGFFKIKNGCILLDKFVDHEYYNDKYYKQLKNYVVSLPSTNSCYFGIMKRVESERSWSFEENEELTRACFGLTFAELEYILKIYAERLGVSHEYGQYPRVTRSLRQNNFCDLTELWIPEGFPYIAFHQSSYDYSHVSLYGFYRHMGLLLSMDKASKIFEHKSFAENIIVRLRNYLPYEIKVTREIVYPEFSKE